MTTKARYKKSFGKNIQKIRLTKGYTEKEVLANTGINIQLLEAGQVDIKPGLLRKLSAFFNIRPSEFMSRQPK
jgi:transcriptional regulator with XRE-family HTH domain